MASWFDYTINGLIIGNIYALLAVGLALIFGVSRLINFAHGSVYLVGAYAGFVAITHLNTPLPITIVIVIAVGALLGLVATAWTLVVPVLAIVLVLFLRETGPANGLSVAGRPST